MSGPVCARRTAVAVENGRRLAEMREAGTAPVRLSKELLIPGLLEICGEPTVRYLTENGKAVHFCERCAAEAGPGLEAKGLRRAP